MGFREILGLLWGSRLGGSPESVRGNPVMLVAEGGDREERKGFSGILEPELAGLGDTFNVQNERETHGC